MRSLDMRIGNRSTPAFDIKRNPVDAWQRQVHPRPCPWHDESAITVLQRNNAEEL